MEDNCRQLVTRRRSVNPSPKTRLNNRSGSNPSLSPKRMVRNDGRSPSTKTGNQSPGHKAPDPSAFYHGCDVSQSFAPDGAPKRVRKGRGFIERYSFARQYRTQCSPPRSFQYGRRNIERNRNWYSRYSSHRSHLEHSPRRHYRSPQRGRSPPRYNCRSRSWSISCSPYCHYWDRSQSQSPICSPSPRDKLPSISEGLKSCVGPKIDEGHSPIKRRFRPRSRSLSRGSSSHSKSPEASPAKNRNRISSASPSKSVSSSLSGQIGLVS